MVCRQERQIVQSQLNLGDFLPRFSLSVGRLTIGSDGFAQPLTEFSGRVYTGDDFERLGFSTGFALIDSYHLRAAERSLRQFGLAVPWTRIPQWKSRCWKSELECSTSRSMFGGRPN